MLQPDHRLLHLQADGLTPWLDLPSAVPSHPASVPSNLLPAFLRAVDGLDRPRDRERARRMKAAHALVQDEVGESRIGLDALARWHGVACPGEGLRTGAWAFAKGGAERYSGDPQGLQKRFLWLGEAPPLPRALRTYLDILFFHPFTDGNSRAARLAFHYLSALGGLEFRTVDPLFRLSLPAGNVRAYTLFQDLAGRLLEGPAPSL